MKNNKRRAKIREFDRLEREETDDLDIDIDEMTDVDKILSGDFDDSDLDEDDSEDLYGSLADDLDDDDDDFDTYIEGLYD